MMQNKRVKLVVPDFPFKQALQYKQINDSRVPSKLTYEESRLKNQLTTSKFLLKKEEQ